MGNKYQDGIEFIIQNVDKIYNKEIYYDKCEENCEPRGYLINGTKVILKHSNRKNPNHIYFLDLGDNYVSDYLSERDIEILAGDQLNKIVKPPLGVTPKYIFEIKRIQELTRSLYEYAHHNSTEMNYDFMLEWGKELLERLENQKER